MGSDSEEDFQKSFPSAGTAKVPETQKVESENSSALPRSETGGAPKSSESAPAEAVVDALRRLILETTHPEPAVEHPAPRQVVAFVLITVDIVLLYFLIPPEWKEGRAIDFLSKLIPWLVGASMVAFANRLRGWFLGSLGHRAVFASAAVAFVLLLATQLPLYSLGVSLDPWRARLSDEQDKKVWLERRGDTALLHFPRLNAYEVTVNDPSCPAKDTQDFTARLGRWRILQGTLAQFPVVGRVFESSPIRLTALYRVSVLSKEGDPTLHIKGQFPEGFLRGTECKKKRIKPGYTLECPIDLEMSWIWLPPGPYDFTLKQGQDRQKTQPGTISPGGKNRVDFDGMPWSKSK